MGNTKEGARKAKETMIKKLGGIEAYDAWRLENASKGGKASKGGGFKNKEVAREAGRKGGSVPRVKL